MSLLSPTDFTPHPRPRRTGEPLTGRTPCTLPKPAALIGAVPAAGHPPLELADRRLFNLLLACSWRRLEEGDLDPPNIRAAAARRAIGQERRRDNERLKPALRRLCERAVMIEGVGETPLLHVADLDGQALVWSFPDCLEPVLVDPLRWGRMNLEHACRLRSIAALVLYENLALRANLRWAGWIVSVSELSRLFGRSADDWPGLHKILDGACRAVAAETELRADYATKVAPQTGRVETLTFLIKGKVSAPGSASERLDA